MTTRAKLKAVRLDPDVASFLHGLFQVYLKMRDYNDVFLMDHFKIMLIDSIRRNLDLATVQQRRNNLARQLEVRGVNCKELRSAEHQKYPGNLHDDIDRLTLQDLAAGPSGYMWKRLEYIADQIKSLYL